uniref:Integrase_H2C2 domain-containing protein n=1 Tax=Ascaris lumbricoides TaxID=6252 RepID=A0A0M3I8U4_ASCLU
MVAWTAWLICQDQWPQWQPMGSPNGSMEQDEAIFVSVAPTPFIELNDVERFSHWTALNGTVCRVLEFIDRVRRKPVATLRQYALKATQLLLKQPQREYYEKPVDLSQMDSAGLWHFVSTMHNVTDIENHPVLLPRHGKLTELLIAESHLRLLHAGLQQTLSKFRQQYWYPQSRRTVARVIRECTGCNRWKAAPFALPPFPPVPSARV